MRSIGRLLFVPILSNPASFGTNSGLFGTNFGTSFGTNFPVLFGQPSEHHETAAEMPIRRSNMRLASASNDRVTRTSISERQATVPAPIGPQDRSRKPRRTAPRPGGIEPGLADAMADLV